MRKISLGKRKRGRKMKRMTHEFIDQAVDSYLKSGGKITILDPANRDIQLVLNKSDSFPAADEFLLS